MSAPDRTNRACANFSTQLLRGFVAGLLAVAALTAGVSVASSCAGQPSAVVPPAVVSVS